MAEIISIEELTEDNPIFKSTGISYLKVTHDGKEKKMAIPIQSTGVADAIDSFNKKRPTAPIVNKVVKPSDPAYKELGLTKKQHVKTFDLTDEVYLEELETFQADLGLKIILMGLNLDLKKTKDGEVIEDPDEKIKVLKKIGLTGEHFTQLVQDISALTKWEVEKEESFLD